MVKPLSLPGKRSKVIQRTISGASLFVFCFVLGIFPGLDINGAQSCWRTPDGKTPLELVRQRVSKKNAAYRLNPEQRVHKPPFHSFISKGKKKKFKKFGLGKKNSKSKRCCFLTRKSGFVSENLWLEFTAQTGFSHQVTHLNPRSQSRAPPYIL